MSMRSETGSQLSIHEYIILINTPVIVILGTVGNALSGFVMLRRTFRSQSPSVYFVALALSDTTFLYANSMSKNFVKVLFHVNYSTTYSYSCALYVYLLLVSKCLSAWLIVAMTTERLIVVCNPLRAKVRVTRRRAVVTVMSITGAILVLYSFVLASFTRQLEDDGKIGCAMKLAFRRNSIDIVLKVFDMVVYSLLPSGVLFTCNVALVYKLVQSGRFRQRTVYLPGAHSGAAAGTSAVNGHSRRLTFTLLLVSGVYLTLTFPMTAFLSYAAVVGTVPHYQLIFRSLYTLQLTNSALNLVLYTSGPAFRKELSAVCCLGRKARPGRKKWATTQHSESRRQSRSPGISHAFMTQPCLSLFTSNPHSPTSELPSPMSCMTDC